MAEPVAILGAGLAGNLLAILLARRGFAVTVYDRGAAPGAAAAPAGRSINLALAARGIRALERAEVFAEIRPLLLPMRGRIVHEPGGAVRFLAYGQHEHERILSVSRAALNRRLAGIAEQRFGVDYRFGHECVGFDAGRLAATVRSAAGESRIETRLLLAADGAGSMVRQSLAAAGAVEAREELLDHGYKELVVAAAPGGGFALDPGGLHVWPRGGFMLIALPNPDFTFTATLFLPHRGQPGFDSVTPATVAAFFDAEFPDVLPLVPDLERQFALGPIGSLGTVHCRPWSHSGPRGIDRRVLLIGDAAHAIVPFHGQGMNAAFEDCAELDRLVALLGPDWEAVVARFEAARADDARAIAAMALENYEEMRAAVLDPAFARRAALAFELERRFPGRFVPRYSMVMFHPEIGYAEARRRGAIQATILDEALGAGDAAAGLELAAERVRERL